MKTLSLTDFPGNWQAVVGEVQHTGEPIALELEGMMCGLLLPVQEALRLAARYAPPASVPTGQVAAPADDASRNYLELLRDDPTLVPVVDGRPLEFVTMMNSSYVDPEQLYQFRNPTTRQVFVYRASELQQAIGRTFSRVEFIPQRPKDFVEGRVTSAEL
jgi:hypothetical protein